MEIPYSGKASSVATSLCRLVARALPSKIFAAFSPATSPNYNELVVHLSSPTEEQAAATANTNSSPDLPVEILGEILALLEIPDLVRAGCVCSSWHVAYATLLRSGWYDRRQQTLCLLYTPPHSAAVGDGDDDNVACMYSLAEERVYRLSLPDPPIRNRHIIGSSSDSWLVTANERSELHMVDPVTGEQHALPPAATIEHVTPVFDADAASGGVREYELLSSPSYGEGNNKVSCNMVHYPHELRDHLYVKAFVFFPDGPSSSTAAGPAGRSSYVVVLIHDPFCHYLSFARAGDAEWTWLPPGTGYEDCVFVDGLLYALTSSGGVHAFDLNARSTVGGVSRKVIMDGTNRYGFDGMYLAQTPSGDMLQVWRDQDVVGHDYDDVRRRLDSSASKNTPKKETGKVVQVYRVDRAAKELVEVRSLPGLALFLGRGQSRCLSVEAHMQLKSNRVYFTDDNGRDATSTLWKRRRRDVCVYDLESRSIVVTEKEVLPPRSWCSCPAPVWITPNLTRLMSSVSNNRE